MKSIFSVFLCYCFSANAQVYDIPVKVNHYLLDSFMEGKVKLRSGEISSQLLNYNLLTKEMIFEQKGKYLAIAAPEEVDTVFIGQRKFVQVNNVFYEWIAGTTFPLFIEYTCTVKEPGVPIGIGTSNLTAASASVKSLIRDGGAYRLQLPDEFVVKQSQAFIIRIKWQYFKVKNEKQLGSLFPEKEQVIKEWVKKNHTNFSELKDIILLVQQIQ